MTLESVFEQFRGEINYFIASAIVDVQSGFSIVAHSIDPGFDPTVASPTYAEVVKTHARAQRLLGMDPRDTEDILITTDVAYLMIRLLGTQYYHGLAVTKEGHMGLCRVIMRKYEPVFLRTLTALGV